MSGRSWLALAGTLGASGVGCAVLAWFLAGRTLDVADQWSSVVAAFAAILLGPIGLLVSVLAWRSSRPMGPAVRVGGDVNAPVITGDHNSVGWRG